MYQYTMLSPIFNPNQETIDKFSSIAYRYLMLNTSVYESDPDIYPEELQSIKDNLERYRTEKKVSQTTYFGLTSYAFRYGCIDVLPIIQKLNKQVHYVYMPWREWEMRRYHIIRVNHPDDREKIITAYHPKWATENRDEMIEMQNRITDENLKELGWITA